MARELLGNIKGPKGDKGEQGPQGGKGADGLTPVLILEDNGDLYVDYE